MELERTQFSPSRRSCLICSGPTKCSHMGIDACRACSTFYRRTKEKNVQLVCRTGSGRCTLDRDEGFTCKKCRFERFAQLLEGSQADNPSTSTFVNSLVRKITAPSSNSTASPLDDLFSISPLIGGITKEESVPSAFSVPIPQSTQVIRPPPSSLRPPSTSSLPTSSHPPPSSSTPSVNLPRCDPFSSRSTSVSLERKVMNRIRQSYSLLCLVRRTSELSNRKTPIHPLQAASGDIPFVQATVTSFNQSTRVLVTALFDFASSAFDEFGSLDSNDKWLLVKNFTDYFTCIESFYRAHLLFPGRNNICMSGYTSYFDFDDIATFFSDGPNPANVEQTKGLFDGFLKDHSKIFHETVRRINPTEDEFLALIGLAFWNIDSTAANEKLIGIAERNRKEILHELHVLYKEEKKLNEYAGRLGDLFFFMMTYQTSLARMPERFEYFRLLDLIGDDNLSYQMQKSE